MWMPLSVCLPIFSMVRASRPVFLYSRNVARRMIISFLLMPAKSLKRSRHKTSREQHIQKIVETYRDRKEIEKYSHLASLQEIAENDYNLNIPRYVDTFEEEEPIDIKAVMAEIKELEAKRAELDKEIEVYLKELGIVE